MTASRQQGTKAFDPTALEELNPASNHVKGLRHMSLPRGLQMGPQPGPILSVGPRERPGRGGPRQATTRFLAGRNCEMRKECCLKLLSLGVICYAAIDNKYILPSSKCNGEDVAWNGEGAELGFSGQEGLYSCFPSPCDFSCSAHVLVRGAVQWDYTQHLKCRP